MILREIKNIFIKNRLTEGVDFVRKEWLKGDGVAYINFPDTVAFSIKIKEFDTNVTNYARGYKLDTDRLLRLYVGKGGSTTNCSGLVIDKADGRITTNYRSPLSDIGLGEHIITKTAETDGIGVFTDGVRHRKNASTDIDYIGTDLIFNQLIPNSNLYIGYLMSTSLNFIPCQLLKSIPATLDANNIARSAGECGMYDSISGKFYGNVANSGTFTVEGEVEPETHTGLQQIYQNRLIEGVDYETYEWLKGDGTAYIDTKVTNLSISDYIKTIFDDSGNIGVKIRTWGREKNRVIVGNNKSTTSITVWGASSSFVYSNSGVYLYDMYFDLLNNKVIINNQTYNLSLPKGNGASFLLFAIRNSSNAVDYKNLAKYKSFEVHNQINLVPCQLLRSIPRNLDAKCKERVAGECGMIDLISGKFYGNVANSGTFTVENDTENNE